jgi:hypothetical protein
VVQLHECAHVELYIVGREQWQSVFCGPSTGKEVLHSNDGSKTAFILSVLNVIAHLI